MALSSDTRLAGFCALYCADCPIFKAATDRELAGQLAEKHGWPVDSIKCDGCKGAPENQWSDDCEIRLCAVGKDLDFCYQCGQYPCDRFAALAERYPHLKASMAKLQAVGVEDWLDWNKRGRPAES